MKKQYWLILIAIVLGIILAIFLMRPHKEIGVFPETLQVYNYTEHTELDTTALIILDKILNLDTINLFIYYSPVNYNSAEIEVMGFIQKNPFQLHTYAIFVSKTTILTPKNFLSHELAHLEQMEKGELIDVLGSGGIFKVYKGDTIHLLVTEYSQRPFEADADKRAFEIRRQLSKY